MDSRLRQQLATAFLPFTACPLAGPLERPTWRGCTVPRSKATPISSQNSNASSAPGSWTSLATYLFLFA